MKHFYLSFIFIIAAGYAYGQFHPSYDPNWEVVFEDHFNSFNTARWWKETGVRKSGTWEEDPGYYLPENAYILNGKLVLRVKRDTNFHNLPCYYNQDGEHHYSSASVVSCSPYQYGYFEIRAQVPTSDGYWPAFWLWNDNSLSATPGNCWYNEIDIFEGKGCYPDSIYANVHWDFNCDSDLHNVNTPHCRDLSNYHWFGLEWDKEWVRWYYDRVAFREERNTWGGIGIQHALYIILSVSLTPDDYVENTISSNTILPNYYRIAQANVYRLKYNCNTVIVEIPNFSSYQYNVKKSITLSGSTQLPAGSDIHLRATEFIDLTNGFEVPIGTAFYANTSPCP